MRFGTRVEIEPATFDCIDGSPLAAATHRWATSARLTSKNPPSSEHLSWSTFSGSGYDILGLIPAHLT